MTKLRCQMSMSLDGFIAGPNPSEEHPLGEGGMQLHEWAFRLAAWRKVAVLLGGGSRLLDNLAGADVKLEQVRVVEAPGVTHLRYRVLG